MNKNQIKGTAKAVVGKAQEEAGKLVGSDDQQIKGLDKQIAGKIQQSVGDVEEIIKAKVRSI
ncbi:MAG: CsbD family protein [Burkholderiaceae bacterium]